VLAVLCRYRPQTLRSLYAVIEQEDKERFYRAYTADTLYLIARSMYEKIGIEYPFKAYSAYENEPESVQDTRTESEIADSIISRLREVRKT
jgi:hypothetical protein